MTVVKGTIRPIRDHILVVDMAFEEQITKGGIYIPSDNGKSEGVKPRWGRVWAIGNEQKDVKVGEWVLVEHGRWTRGHTYETETGEQLTFRMVEPKAIMMSADEPPKGVTFGIASVGHGDSFDFTKPMFEQ